MFSFENTVAVSQYALYRFGRSDCTRIRLKFGKVVFHLTSAH